MRKQTNDDAPDLPPPPAGEGRGGGKPRWLVTPKIRKHARALRAEQTDAEKVLWRELRGHRLNGAGFRRQTPIGSYIVDFISHRAKLIVEIDGGQHFENARLLQDLRRSRYLESKGFRVLRFANNEVLQNRAGVLVTINAALEAAPSLPSPASGGGNEHRETL
ncbi:MAG: endonuclease domain-containing protein [Xanthobacteraceae bacterium]|nr:endonuclease domain-containing protein [Xanthobacteraceae bacterium]